MSPEADAPNVRPASMLDILTPSPEPAVRRWRGGQEGEAVVKYEEMHPIDREGALAMLEAGDVHSVSRAILRLALHDPDDRWVTEQALNLLKSPEVGIRAVAATALGHTARIHRKVDERVVPALQQMLTDPETSGRARDALDDIEMFALHPGK